MGKPAPKPIASAFGVFFIHPTTRRVTPCEAYEIDADGNTISGDHDDGAQVTAAYEAGRPFLTYEGYATRFEAQGSIERTMQGRTPIPYIVLPLPVGTHFHLRDEAETLAVCAPHSPAPEGIEYGIVAYLTSDSEGIDTTVKVTGPGGPTHALPDACMRLSRFEELQAIATDWRPMTRAEITEYKRENA